MPMDVIGSMLSIPVKLSECPDSLLTLLFMCQNWAKNQPEVNGIIIQYWTINPGGIPQFSYKPITGVDRFNVLSMKECSSADWNLKDTSAWGESAHCTNGM